MNQRFKLVTFDLDGTLTQERSIWEYIHKRLGKWYGYAENYQNQFLAGEISYQRFCDLDAGVWKGMRIEDLFEIVKTVPFYPGMQELIDHIKIKGLKLALVSSGLSALSDWVHDQYGFDYSVANQLLHENGVLTGKVNVQVNFNQKAGCVEKVLDRLGVKPEETIAIGDSAGDIDMFKMVGFSIAINSSCCDLEEIATICIQSGNLTDIVPKLPF